MNNTKEPLYDIMTITPLLQFVISQASTNKEAQKALDTWNANRAKIKKEKK